ncbi:MAG: transglycosylase domain-containing protein [Proteobacteria bacterium]|nr:transglycosylase domain-containing protein [Pseudomonadota bacterium]
MRLKVVVIILVVITVLAVVAFAGMLTLQSVAETKVKQRLAAVAEQLGWTMDVEGIELAPLRNGACISSLSAQGQHGSQFSIRDLCINDGLLSLMGDAPTVSTSLAQASVHLTYDDVAAFVQRQTKDKETSGRDTATISKLRQVTAEMNVARFDVTFEKDADRAQLSGEHARLRLDQGMATATLMVNTNLNLPSAPLTLKTSPAFEVQGDVDLGTKSGQITLKATPPLIVEAVRSEVGIEASIAGLNLKAAAERITASPQGIDLTFSAPFDFIAKTHIVAIDLNYDPTPREEATLKDRLTITVHEPSLTLDAVKLLESKQFQALPGVSALMGYWRQDAGSILGKAPKLSVKRSDREPRSVRNREPAKTPFPKENLQAMQSAFEKLQKQIQALPIINIEQGNLNVVHGESVYDFKAISLSSASFLESDRRLKLDFKIRDSYAKFDLSFDAEQSFPSLRLQMDNVSATDFLHLVNLPIPDKTSGEFFGRLEVSIDEEKLNVEGNIRFDNFSLFHAKISPNLIEGIQVGAELSLRYVFAEDTLIIAPMSFSSGPVTISGHVRVAALRTQPTIDFEISAPNTQCADIPKAIPKGLLPTITDLAMGGTQFSPSLKGRIPWKNPLSLSLSETGFTNDCFPTSVYPYTPEDLNSPTYTFTTDYTYFVDAITVGPGTREYLPLDRIPPYVQAAMFLTEDKRFYDHGPLRLSFIERAMRLNLNLRRYVYGGSTISQQLVKNLFLDRRKNLARKLEEAFVTWRMEMVVPKSRIFELYLNVIEFGPDVYGVVQGAKFYFAKSPEELTPLEAAYLASLKVAPSRGGRFYATGFSDKKWWHNRMRQILKILAENGYITAGDVVAAYPWIPKFVYPPPEDKRDYRNIWLENYRQYLKTGRLSQTDDEPQPQDNAE